MYYNRLFIFVFFTVRGQRSIEINDMKEQINEIINNQEDIVKILRNLNDKVHEIQNHQDNNARQITNQPPNAPKLNQPNSVEAFSQFALKLYREVQAEKTGENFVISAFSLETVLAMLYFGSSGNTKEEMKALMKFPTDVELSSYMMETLELMKKPKNYILEMANSIFISKEYTLKSRFKAQMKEVFYSEIKKTDFRNAEIAAGEINHWAAIKTRNKIQNLLTAGSLKSNTAMLLLNAILFKGKWDQKFEKTYKRQFLVEKGRSVEVDMMNQEGKFRAKLAIDFEAKILELPFNKGSVNMFLVLPLEDLQLAQLEDKITKSSNIEVLELLNMKKERKLSYLVELPKFKLQTDVKLLNILYKLGFQNIFEHGKFNEMTDSSLTVNAAFQKAFLEVNEEGAEAAAVSGIELRGESASPGFVVNHPFMFFIQQRDTKKILFQGRVVDPTKE